MEDEPCVKAALFMLERSNVLLEWSAAICVAHLWIERVNTALRIKSW